MGWSGPLPPSGHRTLRPAPTTQSGGHAALHSVLRASDFAGRWGGEEFLILLPDTDVEGAVGVAEKARKAIGEIFVPEVDRLISASIGIATIPDHAGDAENLERCADRALYTAKRNGRDHVESATTETIRDRAGSSAAGELVCPYRAGAVVTVTAIPPTRPA